MTEQAQSMLGRQLGNYTLTRLLGRGGFAEVYLGIHKHLETQAAIKVLLARLSQADQDSFLAEARTVARLRHPHIVHILEFGIEDETPYLVMNYATHGTLRHHFTRGVPVAPESILPYLRQIASALQYAHDQQLIHRDIKPENMLLDEQHTVFLSDFGIATHARSSRSQTMEEVIGTVAYMAPEQLQGKPRPASDQYALAVVVYEWLCGVRPFQGSSYITIASQHISTPPPPLRTHVPALSLALEQVVLTALSKDHHQRYARVMDFVEALEQAHLNGLYLSPQDFANRPTMEASPAPVPRPASSASQPLEPTQLAGSLPTQYTPVATQPSTPTYLPATPTLPPPGSAFSRRALLGGGAAALLLAGGGVTWWVVSHQSSQTPGSGTASTPSLKGVYLSQAKLIRTCKYNTDVASVAWSADGSYVASVEGDQIVHVWHAQTGVDVWQAQAPSYINQLDWSADGRRLAVCADHALIYDTASWHLSATSAFACRGLAWSPDGKTLAASNIDQEIEVVLWDGVKGHAPSASLEGFDAVVSLAWRPDGKQLAVSTTSTDGSFSSVLLWNGKGKPSLFTPKSNGEISTSWSSSGHQYLASAGAGLVEIWDVATLGQAYDKTNALACKPALWSPDGRFLASATPDSHIIRVWDGTSFGAVSTCQGHSDVITALAWSRDGNYLASVSKDRTVRVWQVRE